MQSFVTKTDLFTSSFQVTVDLDVLVRSRLLAFLVEECETRGATILYATHIFDGLDAFPSHLCHLQLGSTIAPSPFAWPIDFSVLAPGELAPGVPAGVREKMEDPDRSGSRLLELALSWLVEDKAARVEREMEVIGRRKRGAQALPTDSEAFYRKCVHELGAGKRRLCADVSLVAGMIMLTRR